MSKRRTIERNAEGTEIIVADWSHDPDTNQASDVVAVTLTPEDIQKISGMLPQPVNVYGVPKVEAEEGEGVLLSMSNVSVHVPRASWDQFKQDVNDLELPAIKVTDTLPVYLRGSFEVRVDVDIMEALFSDDMMVDGMWTGSEDELFDAVKSYLDYADTNDLGLDFMTLYDLDQISIDDANFDESDVTG